MQTLPVTFAKHFDQRILYAHPSTLVAIAVDGEIQWLNEAWYEFARANGGANTLSRFLVGSNYFDGIACPQLRTFFQRQLSDAYEQAQIFELEYECSSPDVRRLFRMRALPIAHAGLLVEHVKIYEGAISHPAKRAELEHYVNADGLIVQCSNCRKVKRADGRTWDWVREWVSLQQSRVSHGLCEVCFGFYWGHKIGLPPEGEDS